MKVFILFSLVTVLVILGINRTFYLAEPYLNFVEVENIISTMKNTTPTLSTCSNSLTVFFEGVDRNLLTRNFNKKGMKCVNFKDLPFTDKGV